MSPILIPIHVYDLIESEIRLFFSQKYIKWFAFYIVADKIYVYPYFWLAIFKETNNCKSHETELLKFSDGKKSYENRFLYTSFQVYFFALFQEYMKSLRTPQHS